MRTSFLKLAALVIAVCACAGMIFAQATDANLVGTVMDPSGGGIPNATVTLENVATGVKYTAVADSNGLYRFNNVPVGQYNVTATAGGFTTATLRNLNLQLNRTQTANLSLAVGSVATTVDVTDSGVLIDTTTAQLGSTYQNREAIDTPMSALPLGVLNLSLLSAGVASSGGIGLGEGPSVGGQRPRNNNFTIEGVDNNRKDVTGHTVDVPNEAVAEFSVLQNQYTAEFGNGTGGQFNTVIRGGTNAVHGSIFEYFQNRNLNAVDESSARQGIRSNTRYDQNVLGGSIGGPIVKNKLFYYGLFQYNPLGNASSPSSAILAPTAAGYQTLAGMQGLSKTNLGILQQYLPPAPSATDTSTVQGVAIPIGILPVIKPTYTNTYTWLVSLDYNISEKDQLRGRYIDGRIRGFSETTLPDLPAFFQGRKTSTYLATISEFHTFSPTLFNEIRLGYNRYNDDIPAGNFAYPGLDVFPNITIEQDLNLQLGPFNNAPQSSVINTYQIVDNVSWNPTGHGFKFGIDFKRYIAPQFFTQRVRGDYNYSSMERFLLDVSPDLQAQRNVGSAAYWGNNNQFAWFAQDTWRVRNNLSLTLGLRHEYKGVPAGDKLQVLNAISSVPGLLEFREPKAQRNAFSPRVGIAYSPGTSGRTSIRAGFGLAYDKYFDNLGLNAKPPQLESTVDVLPSANIPNFLASGGILPTARGQAFADAAEARSATSAYIPDQQLPYSIQWNIGVQHAFGGDYTFEARYLGTRGVHLITQDRINAFAPVNAQRNLPTYLQNPGAAALAGLQYTLGDLRAIDPILPEFAAAGFGDAFITSFPFRGNSVYHGLATELTRRFSRGLLFKGAYTWSHNIDDSTADLFSTLLAPRRPEDFRNMRAERSSSFLDRRHRFTFNAVWDMPWFNRSDNWALKNLVGNWILGGTYIVESPQYATVQSGVDSNLNGDSAGDRAIVNPSGVKMTGSAVNAINRLGQVVPAGDPTTVAYVAQNPNAQYIQAGLGAFTNSGRMTMPMGKINNFDFNVKKGFNITENKRLEFSALLFNAFNHPQYTPGYPNNAQFRESDTTRNHLIPGNAIFNRPDLVFASNARTMILVGRFQF
ncbi:MAG TPA: TonB-dependent receptor [Bryobacteraceae bacterium]|nr:TonB-dependent receptor [Bryobacteraceae bacterium]